MKDIFSFEERFACEIEEFLEKFNKANNTKIFAGEIGFDGDNEKKIYLVSNGKCFVSANRMSVSFYVEGENDGLG